MIAGHSQGSAMILILLRTHFRDHPGYHAHMVAACAIGCSVTGEYPAANPHLKFAAGESDTGVIIARNTEGPGNVKTGARNIVVLPHTGSTAGNRRKPMLRQAGPGFSHAQRKCRPEIVDMVRMLRSALPAAWP